MDAPARGCLPSLYFLRFLRNISPRPGFKARHVIQPNRRDKRNHHKPQLKGHPLNIAIPQIVGNERLREYSAPPALPRPLASCNEVLKRVFAELISAAGTSANASELMPVNCIERLNPPINNSARVSIAVSLALKAQKNSDNTQTTPLPISSF
jgi:hypothetical protein